MPLYYDKTSPIGNAGFGKLDGNWTGVSFWSTSSGGTAAAGQTWASDTAFFGGTTGAAEGGTINVNSNVTVFGITVQNLTTTLKQTIAGSSVLTFTAAAPISVGSGLELEITAPMAFGAAAVSKTGTGRLTLSGTAASTVTTGTFAINAGTVYITRAINCQLTAPVTVNSSATLAGFNSVDPVRMRLRGALTLAAGSTVVFGIPS